MADLLIVGLSVAGTALILVEFAVYGFDFDALFFKEEETTDEL